MIIPTVGRVVWYHCAEGDIIPHTDVQPLAAHIAFVHDDSLVNLMVIDSNGNPHSRAKVPLTQPGDPQPLDTAWCMWMPYQVGQAAKTEEVIKAAGEQKPVVQVQDVTTEEQADKMIAAADAPGAAQDPPAQTPAEG